MAWNGKTVIDSEKYDDNYSFGTDDIITDKDGFAVSVILTDYTNNKDGIVREYRLHPTTLGSYVNFHGHRSYILVSDLF